MEAAPVLPSDEMERLASPSAGLSGSGGVFGTRSGLPDSVPVNKMDIFFAVELTETLTDQITGEASLLTTVSLRVCAFKMTVIHDSRFNSWLCGCVG